MWPGRVRPVAPARQMTAGRRSSSWTLLQLLGMLSAPQARAAASKVVVCSACSQESAGGARGSLPWPCWLNTTPLSRCAGCMGSALAPLARYSRSTHAGPAPPSEQVGCRDLVCRCSPSAHPSIHRPGQRHVQLHLPAPAGGGIQPLRLRLHRFAGNWLKTDFELHIIQPACSTSRTCRCLYISAALQGVGQADGASVADAGGGGAAKHTWMSEKELADDPVANQV